MHVVMTKKKRYKFSVELWLNELTAVPFLNAVLFAKVRLLDGGSFVQHSSREEVKDHVVQWGEVFHFQCKMSANANTGVLEPCFCRISVRKEVKGGRSFQKLGMVDLNLAEVAGGGRNARRCLLREYTEKHRLDNSTLNVTINMILLSGDPCFKTPTVNRCWLPGESIDDSLCLINETMDQFPESIQSRSLIRLAPKNTVVSCSLPELSADGSRFEPSHSRHSSSTSQASRASGESTVPGRGATSSSGPASECSTFERPVDRRKGEESRVQITRVNPDRVVSELVKDFSSVPDESSETSGLQLFVCRDGRTALSSHELLAPGSFLPIVIERKL